jgi:hypothetical protein
LKIAEELMKIISLKEYFKFILQSITKYISSLIFLDFNKTNNGYQIMKNKTTITQTIHQNKRTVEKAKSEK